MSIDHESDNTLFCQADKSKNPTIIVKERPTEVLFRGLAYSAVVSSDRPR